VRKSESKMGEMAFYISGGEMENPLIGLEVFEL